MAESVNAVEWSRRIGHDQGRLHAGPAAILTFGGQRPVDAQGRLLHGGDLVAQVALTLDNVTEVVAAAGFAFTDVAHLRVHTTEMRGLRDAQFVVTEHLARWGATTPVTFVEVRGLALPGMEVEIDGLAIRAAPAIERPGVEAAEPGDRPRATTEGADR